MMSIFYVDRRFFSFVMGNIFRKVLYIKILSQITVYNLFAILIIEGDLVLFHENYMLPLQYAF